MVLKNAHLWPRLQVADAGLQLGRAFCPLPSSADYQSNGGSADKSTKEARQLYPNSDKLGDVGLCRF